MSNCQGKRYIKSESRYSIIAEIVIVAKETFSESKLVSFLQNMIQKGSNDTNKPRKKTNMSALHQILHTHSMHLLSVSDTLLYEYDDI